MKTHPWSCKHPQYCFWNIIFRVHWEHVLQIYYLARKTNGTNKKAMMIIGRARPHSSTWTSTYSGPEVAPPMMGWWPKAKRTHGRYRGCRSLLRVGGLVGGELPVVSGLSLIGGQHQRDPGRWLDGGAGGLDAFWARSTQVTFGTWRGLFTTYPHSILDPSLVWFFILHRKSTYNNYFQLMLHPVIARKKGVAQHRCSG